MPIIIGYYFRYRPPLSSLRVAIMLTLKTRVTILPKIFFSGSRRKSVSNFYTWHHKTQFLTKFELIWPLYLSKFVLKIPMKIR